MSLPEDELSLFMRRLADGDRSAFDPLYFKLKPRISALCRTMLGHEQDAEDAVQIVMEKIFARAALYERERPVMPWALGIAAWECRAYRQKRKRRREDALPADMTSLAVSSEISEDLAQRELEKLAASTLGVLSPQDRETLNATFWDEATASGVTGATMRKRRERALSRLRSVFGRLYGFDTAD